MRLTFALLALLVAPAVRAQQAPPPPADSATADSAWAGGPFDADGVATDGPSATDELALLFGGSVSLGFMQGGFADSTGSTLLGGGGAIGLLRGRLGYGGELAVYAVSAHRERLALPSGVDADVVTRTLLTRAVAFGRYGPRWSGGYAYAEALAGVNVLSTSTSFADDSQGGGADRQKTALAPALGGGVGLIVRLLPSSTLALHAQARLIYGGPATYLVYREGPGGQSGGFVERRTGTTMAAVMLGVNVGM